MAGENGPLHVAKRGQALGKFPGIRGITGLACVVLNRAESYP
jgi:hypothetical protein